MNKKIQKATQKNKITFAVITAIALAITCILFAVSQRISTKSIFDSGDSTSSWSLFEGIPNPLNNSVTKSISSDNFTGTSSYISSDNIPLPKDTSKFQPNTSLSSPAPFGAAANIYATAENGAVINGTATIKKVTVGQEANEKYTAYRNVLGLTIPTTSNDTFPAILSIKMNMQTKQNTGIDYTQYKMKPIIIFQKNTNNTIWNLPFLNNKYYDLTSSFLCGNNDKIINSQSKNWDGTTYYVFTMLPKNQEVYLCFDSDTKTPVAVMKLH